MVSLFQTMIHSYNRPCVHSQTVIIIIMYIYRMLINALSACIIHINLNMIFCTHAEHGPVENNLHKVLYGNTPTHTAMNLNVHDTDQYHTSYLRAHAHTHTHTHTHTHMCTNIYLIIIGYFWCPIL